jgi:diadenosine tetraphosphate (Ap4A) HIT family hydrolase
MTEIHPQLQQDCVRIGRFPLCHLLLMRDANYPWFILVPDRNEVSEIFQLSEQEQIQLTRESSLMARMLADAFAADKINIAALGNVVPQLHIHHVARYRDDACWPKPVWGQVPAKAYTENGMKERIRQTQDFLAAAEAEFQPTS